jgi:hypothetical protein
MERANLGHPTAARNGSLKTSLRVRDITQETECVEEVRFPSGVRADEERPPAKWNVNVAKVTPVFDVQVSDSHPTA